jgi:XRN 5'-3' exonuclease N-terminus
MACSSSSSSSSSSSRWCRSVTCVLLCLTQLLYTADAGIAGFSKWFSGTFQSAVLDVMPNQSDKFDHVCFDMNQILHVSLHRAKTEEEAVSTVFFQVLAYTYKQLPKLQSVRVFSGFVIM